MSLLSEDILNEIFYLKHNIEFRAVVEQLIDLRIKTFINLTYTEIKGMIYLHKNMKVFSLNYHNIDCSCYQILKLIKNK